MGKSTKQKYQNKLNRIKNLIEKEEYKRAIYEMVKYLSEYPDDIKAHYLYGKILLIINNLQAAKREFKLVTEFQDENETKALMRLASIAIQEGSPEEAISYYQKVIIDSKYRDIYAINKLAHLYRHEKRYKEALDILSKTPVANYELEIERAKNLSLLGRVEESWNILETITPNTRAEERNTFLNKGRTLVKEDYYKAKFYYELAKEHLEEDDIYYKAVYEEAKLDLMYNRYEEVIQYCQELEKASKTFDGEVYLLFGLAEQKMGDYLNAHLNYQKTAAESQDRDLRAKGYYYGASLDFAEGNLPQAEINFKRSIANSRTFQPQAYTKLIGALFREEKYNEAKKYLERVRQQRPELIKDDKPLAYMELLIAKKQGKKLPRRDDVCYAESQIIKYQEKDAIAHIESHHANKARKRGSFLPNIDISELFYFAKQNLISENLVNEDAMDIYEIDYAKVGYDLDDNLVSRIRVVVFPNTKNILTMYPGCRATVPRQGEIKQNKASQNVKKLEKHSFFNKKASESSN